MSTRTQQRLGVTSLVLLAIAFVAAVIVSNQLLKGARIDLTENDLYTLSDGTERILADIGEPINLYLYFSDEASEGLPRIRDYALRVRELLEEFVAESGGRLQLEVIDPVPFSEAEDRAAGFGLQGLPIGPTGDPVYLGLAGTNAVGDEEVIPFFDPQKENFLEYDVARLVATLADPQRPVIGLVSGLSMSGGFDPRSQRMERPWVVWDQARQLFDIRDLGTDFEAVPAEVDLLWIVHPKGLAAPARYAIDQFVLRGGRALIFVDPVAMADPAAAPGMPPGMAGGGQSSDLPELFAAWGIDFSADRVVADARLALQVGSPSGRPVRHYGYLGIPAGQMNAEDVVTAELGVINAATPGRIALSATGSEDGEDERPALSFEPLLRSSPDSALIPASRFAFLADPADLQQDFSPGGEPMVIAARVSGTLPSAFPDGPPAGEADEAKDNADADIDAGQDIDTGHLSASAEPANLIVVADVDLLSDPLWVQVQNFFGQQIASAFASNGAFVVNALESLTGSADLISVRSRGSFSRPFTKVEELRAEAEARYLATEQRLEQELAETERRLAELQSSREDGASLLLTDDQQAEIERFVDQRAEIRRELRAVQRGLDEDIDRLGTWLKVINIGLVPALLTLIALLAVWRRRDREAA
ncbi:MAG: Gldg family protein [Gammaproteobacteria bacterium]